MRSLQHPVTYNRFPFEAIFWFAALCVLAVIDVRDSTHFSICPIERAGFDFCPGCGLGRSISMLFHGDFAASFDMHPLGIFAVVVLTARIIKLSHAYLKYHGKSS